jgi:hypothetical protein
MCAPGVDVLVDHTDLDRRIYSSGNAFVLGGRLVVRRVALLGSAGSQFFLCRMPTALAPITATSASGHANTSVAFSEREFIAM